MNLRAVPVAAIILGLATGCGSSEDTGDGGGGGGSEASANDPVEVGFAAARTGWLAPYDGPFDRGLQLCIKQINSSGGAGGRKIQVRIEDMRSEPAQGVVVAQELLDDGVDVLLTPSDADPAIAVGQVAQKRGVPALASGASTPTIPQSVGDEMFMVSMGDNAQGAVLAEYALDNGYKTAYVLSSPDSAYSQKLPQYFEKNFTAGGGKVTGTGTFKLGGGDFSAEVTKIRGLAQQPDVIMSSASIPDSPTFYKQLRAAGVDTPVISADGNDGPQLTEAAGEAAEGLVFTTHGFPQPGNSVAKFYADYEKEYGKAPDTIFTAVGCDAGRLIAAAVEKAGSTDPGKIRAALDTLKEVPGATGSITMAGQGRVPLKQVSLVKVTDGKLELLKQVTPSDVPAP